MPFYRKKKNHDNYSNIFEKFNENLKNIDNYNINQETVREKIKQSFPIERQNNEHLFQSFPIELQNNKDVSQSFPIELQKNENVSIIKRQLISEEKIKIVIGEKGFIFNFFC